MFCKRFGASKKQCVMHYKGWVGSAIMGTSISRPHRHKARWCNKIWSCKKVSGRGTGHFIVSGNSKYLPKLLQVKLCWYMILLAMMMMVMKMMLNWCENLGNLVLSKWGIPNPGGHHPSLTATAPISLQLPWSSSLGHFTIWSKADIVFNLIIREASQNNKEIYRPKAVNYPCSLAKDNNLTSITSIQ